MLMVIQNESIGLRKQVLFFFKRIALVDFIAKFCTND
jgi:hypothetical protein